MASVRPLQQRIATSVECSKFGRRFAATVHDAYTRQLRELADQEAFDSQSQVRYLKELLKSDPAGVVDRIESRMYAMNEEVFNLYTDALKQTNQFTTSKVRSMYNLLADSSSNNGSLWNAKRNPPPRDGAHAQPRSNEYVFDVRPSAPELAARIVSDGAGREPIQVTIKDGNGLWTAVRWITLGFFGLVVYQTFTESFLSKAGSLALGGEAPKPVEHPSVKFSDVCGADEATSEMSEMVLYLRDPGRFTRLGGRLPKGIMLTGKPGTGKTLLARAVAGEAGVPFFYVSGSEFEEVFVGVGARRVRDLFASARKHAPCIIFIDEIDAVGGARSSRESQQQYTKMTLNQLLVEMDGFAQNAGIVVIAATNLPEVLDKALTRPGRFDRHVHVAPPDIAGRRKILQLYLSKVASDPKVDVDVLARGTVGLTGAELSNLVNVAAVQAAVENCDKVTMKHLDFAKDRVLMGAERKSAVISENSRKLTAYHEAGHAIAIMYTPGAMPLHKATVVPRGHSLGMTVMLPDKDEDHVTRQQLLARLDVAMGGRVAEQLIFGDSEVTTGASSDFQQATNIATAMVTQYGMSDKVGKVVMEPRDRELQSSKTKVLIDTEIRTLLEQSYSRVAVLLKAKEAELHRLAHALQERETLTADEIRLACSGKMANK
eukprot:TRINITY_DN5307_c0_g1_i1.p1 TRINITY_DN5307_c0_g1~~TRINITY_DN5307_c0_g1_i1.p1  ORF type:complete len:690 (+),score=143.26 TRINITY_DN5307_c0_g1_i1:95-2071(+)